MARKSAPAQTVLSAEIVSDSESSTDASSISSSSSSIAKRKLSSKAADTPSKKVKFSDNNETKSITASEATSEASDGSEASEEEEDHDSDDNDASDGDSSSSSEDSSSVSESEEDVNDQTSPQTNGHSEEPPSSSTSPILSSLTYAPPQGFSKVKHVPHKAPHTSMFDPASLDGRQLWHITASASIPMAELQSLNANQIKSGSSVLSYGEAQYSLAHSDESRDIKLLVVDKSGIYRQVKAEIAQHFSLNHTLSLPEKALFPEDMQPVDAPAINVHDVRPAKAQPEGLRTRWWPTGFEDKESLAGNGATLKGSKKQSKKVERASNEDTPRKKHKKDKEKSEKKKRRRSHESDVIMED